ncbi:hypothetical protein [Marinilabilia salmonicolor]|jgi:hypothetical protein|uniref:Peptidylprolyl isomerase n=1 Tax=Marinilabilia salmonicolor TaxID=989 RepID=A0A2T0XH75_9BACT|nr:hypothetical protein [Marinilabilia salmonicolor]PRY98308.1 hypothetical protein BY457_110122 [Marinilabilia salmonicolor]RCW33882.1 hypothetical protein DFO77_11246 [Marinilabilia salmonicolor]
MKRNVLNLLILISLIAGSVLMNACDEGYRINTKEMIREEQELMDEYLDIFVNDTVVETGRTLNYLDSLGYVFFETREGTDDTVKVGKKVGIRYVYYVIARDSTDTPGLYIDQSNYERPEPLVFTAGETDVYSGVFSGLNYAVTNMTYGSKAWVFISSSLWSRQDYTPRVLELEVTYLEK